ncbi:MAG: hypothetical protein AAF235_08380, partial [Planctomycetota bacterium]
PPFPILTPGYEGATSSVAVLRITPPMGAPYERWVYSRFPEISQDLVPGERRGERPTRRDADPAIGVRYLDIPDGLDLHIDEVTPAGSAAPRWRLAARQPDGSVRSVEGVESGVRVADMAPGMDVVVSEGWAHSEVIERPIEVAPADREQRFVGTHDMAKVALEIDISTTNGEGSGSTVVWVPFTRYMGLSPERLRDVDLPDGRVLTLGVGRLQRAFPGFSLRLVDFEMISYDHRGAPRDYQSLIEVVPPPGESTGMFAAYRRVAKLNAPLRAPFVWDDRRSWSSNAGRRMMRGLNPHQYKISQAGWDQAGWARTQALADEGRLAAPYAQFTIMQVGNNPGIHFVALGGVMMAMGIPWAFYVKPWMLRLEKARLAAMSRGRPVACEAESAS